MDCADFQNQSNSNYGYVSLQVLVVPYTLGDGYYLH
jgi:hypothetical protein